MTKTTNTCMNFSYTGLTTSSHQKKKNQTNSDGNTWSGLVSVPHGTWWYLDCPQR